MPPSPGPAPFSPFVAWQAAQLSKTCAPCAAFCARAEATAPMLPATNSTDNKLNAFMPTSSFPHFIVSVAVLATKRGLELARPLYVADQVITEPERERAERASGVVTSVERIDGRAHDEQIFRIPALQMRRNHACVRIRAHDRAAGHVRRLIGAHVIWPFASSRRADNRRTTRLADLLGLFRQIL